MNLMNNLLTVNNLSKTYYSKKGETLAIENVSFSINKNETKTSFKERNSIQSHCP